MGGVYSLMFVGLIPWLLFGGGLFYLGLRYVRALEGRKTGENQLADLQQRIGQIEEAVGQLNSDVNRISEDQRFTTQLLERRST